jgi:hypothetical protein
MHKEICVQQIHCILTMWFSWNPGDDSRRMLCHAWSCEESIQHFEQMCEVGQILHQSIHWVVLVCHTCLEIHASQMSLLETAAFKISSAHLVTGVYL